MATYKKSPKNLEPIWFSSMNRDFCLSLISNELGLPKVKPPCFIIFINRIGFLPLMPLPFRLKRKGLHFTSNSVLKTLLVWIFGVFLNIFSSICVAMLSFCGIVVPFIVAKKSKLLSKNIQEFILNISRLMPLNSIRQNIFGTTLIRLYLTVYQKIWQSLKAIYVLLSTKYDLHKIFYGLAFMPPSYPGQSNSSFLYLCETQ